MTTTAAPAKSRRKVNAIASAKSQRATKRKASGETGKFTRPTAASAKSRRTTKHKANASGKPTGEFIPPELTITPEAMAYMEVNPRLYNGTRIAVAIRTPEDMLTKRDMYGGKNRKPIKSNVKRIVADILGDRYVQDLRIKIVEDQDGNVIDGGNTIESIIQSGRSILVVSLENVPSDIQDVIDQGAKRTAAHINELRDAKEGKPSVPWWPEVTRVAKAMLWAKGKIPGATEMDVADFARPHAELIRQVIALSGTPDGDPSSYPRLKLAPVRAAFFAYALYRKDGIALVRRVMGKIREMRFAGKGDASKAFMDAFSLDRRTTNLSGAKSLRDFFPLAAATLMAEERGIKLSAGKLKDMAADPSTMAEFMALCRQDLGV